MRLRRVTITNFKGITHVDLCDLADTVVIAGPNGCGKSCIFEALRLWKTAYGGYIQHELNSWFAENGIAQDGRGLAKTLQDPTRAMNIYAELELANSEKQWIQNNAESLLRTAAFRRRVPEYALEWKSFGEAGLAENLRIHEENVMKDVNSELPIILDELQKDVAIGSLTCHPDGYAEATASILLSRLFSIYDPDNIGKFDYHSPQRIYNREQVGGINLQIEQYNAQRQQSALYNVSNKYNSVKTELASAYVRDLIKNQNNTSPASSENASLLETLVEMFDRFFPGKRFLGVQPAADGSISFNVETQAGIHDLNELSSGEKELIYGYLRLRNEAPKNSIIMLDEPELHLNPRLTEGLPDFYHKHIGRELNNQLWLVTHSDSILRQSVGKSGFKVFHMQAAGNYSGDNQATGLEAESDLGQAIIDLVGDLAAYKPNAKIVFLEGGGGSTVDEGIVRDLFPTFCQRVNIVSAGNKSKVRLIHHLFEKVQEKGVFSSRFYSITDRDDDPEGVLPKGFFRWDRYHIENYLLEEQFIREALIDLRVDGAVTYTESQVAALLVESAAETLPSLVQHHMESSTSKAITSILRVNSARNEEFNVGSLRANLEESLGNLSQALMGDLAESRLEERAVMVKSRAEDSLRNGTWKCVFRGRDVLKRFTAKHVRKVRYEVFRDLIVSQMVRHNYSPDGMAQVLSAIDEDKA